MVYVCVVCVLYMCVCVVYACVCIYVWYMHVCVVCVSMWSMGECEVCVCMQLGLNTNSHMSYKTHTQN